MNNDEMVGDINKKPINKKTLDYIKREFADYQLYEFGFGGNKYITDDIILIWTYIVDLVGIDCRYDNNGNLIWKQKKIMLSKYMKPYLIADLPLESPFDVLKVPDDIFIDNELIKKWLNTKTREYKKSQKQKTCGFIGKLG